VEVVFGSIRDMTGPGSIRGDGSGGVRGALPGAHAMERLGKPEDISQAVLFLQG